MGSLRQWRGTVGNQYSAATLRALADLVITEAQATRRVARQTLRLAKQMAGDYTRADVGTDLPAACRGMRGSVMERR